jgi:hypothetical protein
LNALVRVVHRLAVGIEVVDAMRGTLADVVVTTEDGATWPRGRRPGRFRQLVRPGLTSPLLVRVTDERRRYVPRRFTLPFDVEEPSWTVRVPLFPGAGFRPHGAATGLRGRVVDQAGHTVPWARVTARHPASHRVAGRAHGDERGEFLLLLVPGPRLDDLFPAFEFTVEITVAVPSVPSDELVAEVPPSLDEVDDITKGEDAPPGYLTGVTSTIGMRLGELIVPAYTFTVN